VLVVDFGDADRERGGPRNGHMQCSLEEAPLQAFRGLRNVADTG
jgi:hypothetical protein